MLLSGCLLTVVLKLVFKHRTKWILTFKSSIKNIDEKDRYTSVGFTRHFVASIQRKSTASDASYCYYLYFILLYHVDSSTYTWRSTYTTNKHDYILHRQLYFFFIIIFIFVRLKVTLSFLRPWEIVLVIVSLSSVCYFLLEFN